MAIGFGCDCGQWFEVGDDLGGRRGKCTRCGQVVAIPEAVAAEPAAALADPGIEIEVDDDPPAPAPADRCDACDEPMREGAIICVHCGYNRQTGDRLTVEAGEAADDAPAGPPRRLRLNFGGIEISPLRVMALVVPVVGLVAWYVLGPARDVHVLRVETVAVAEVLGSGAVREPYSLVTGEGDRSLGLKAPQSRSQPNPHIADVDEVYSVGAGDQMLVSRPHPDGPWLLLEVGLKQAVINEMEHTQRYDNVLLDDYFKLEPVAGGPALSGRLLYARFDDPKLEVDLGGAQTSSYSAMFPPVDPTEKEVEKQMGLLSGRATWDQPHVTGEIDFRCAYSFEGFPAAKGLFGTGDVRITSDDGPTVELAYRGPTLEVSWNGSATGWWGRTQFSEESAMSPWHRYRLGLLFPRPDGDGKHRLTYGGKHVATVRPAPSPAPAPTAARGAQKPAPGSEASPGSPPSGTGYFDMLVDARDQARNVVAASNLRQIGFGLRMYLDEHATWPDEIGRLRSVIDSYDAVMTHPRTKERPGFIYRRPTDPADPSTTPVLHEARQGQIDPDGAVLYADGHIEQR